MCVVSIGIGAIPGIVSYGFNAFSPVFVSFLTEEYLEEPSSFFSQFDDEAQYIDVWRINSVNYLNHLMYHPLLLKTLNPSIRYHIEFIEFNI